MQSRFALRRVADGQLGERFVIVLEAADGNHGDASKPLSAPHARLALHKLGTSDAVIDSLFQHARDLPDDEAPQRPS
jgi:hypothetical protein